ncbi:response regulator transcription factor [Devosia sp.]|uniref:response regulator n=1 Tax=Devosia sp. TaxID=1871048 RepID=UPI0025C6570E|nr:response regulator transcription factor [Devosia sp.]
MNRPIRDCLLVEDIPATRTWLETALATAFPGIAIKSCGTIRAAQKLLDHRTAPFSIALVDLGLPDGSGLDLLRRLTLEMPETLAIVATIYDDDTHLFDAIMAGAQGYVLKDEDTDLIGSLLARIGHGEPPLSPSIARRVLAHFRASAVASEPDEAGLTARETEVLTLIAKGMTVAETARLIALKPQTVASYVKTIYSKLNISTRSEATLEAVRRGLA